MRVGYDIAPLSLNFAGEARYTASLMQGLIRFSDVELEIMTASRRVPRKPVQRLAYKAWAEGVYYPLLVGRHARREAVDLIHYPRHLVSPQLGMSVANVLTLADVIPLTHPQFFKPSMVGHMRLLTPRAAKHATRLITHSAATRAEITRLFDIPPSRIAVIPHGVGEIFRPAGADAEWLRRRIGIDGPYVLCVATFEPRKNLVGVIEAMERVQRQFPDHALVLTGRRGWLNAETDAALTRIRSKVVQTGYVSDEELVRLYSGAACFVYPSFLEGFGFPVLEAMACGAPVVTSNRSSLPEVAGDAAILVDPDSPEDIGDGIATVLASPARQEDMRRRGLERSSGFTWRAAVEATVEIYREALAAYPGDV
ncbi:MAG: hypothetical protein NVSMB25_07710 [Thermoleophilaceae bacterium]